jgi:hypothetical protein
VHILAMRPEEPQSYRDLALVLDRQGEFRRAAKLLWALVIGEWDGRFPEIETIALMELNRVLERARRESQAGSRAGTGDRPAAGEAAGSGPPSRAFLGCRPHGR